MPNLLHTSTESCHQAQVGALIMMCTVFCIVYLTTVHFIYCQNTHFMLCPHVSVTLPAAIKSTSYLSAAPYLGVVVAVLVVL